MVLGGEDVATAPLDLGAEFREGLDQHRGLDGHVQAAGDAGAGERLAGAIFLPQRHQARHFLLGQSNFLAAPFGQGDIGNLIRQFGLDLQHGWLLLIAVSS